MLNYAPFLAGHSTKYRHAWNVIRIDGQYYHLDATFDNTLSKDDTVRYDYVNLSDKQIFRDHEPVIWKVPACTDGEHFYYKEKKISWTPVDEVRNRTKQAVKKGRILLFHWRGGYLTKEVLKEFLVVFDEEANEGEKNQYLFAKSNTLWYNSETETVTKSHRGANLDGWKAENEYNKN